MSVKALVDCRATGDFIDSEYVISHNLPVWRLSQPIPVLNVDGSPNQAGGITSVVDMVVDYKGHSERIQLDVTDSGSSMSSSVTPGSRNTIRRSTGRPRKFT
jgi:hypothetical protein